MMIRRHLLVVRGLVALAFTACVVLCRALDASAEPNVVLQDRARPADPSAIMATSGIVLYYQLVADDNTIAEHLTIWDDQLGAPHTFTLSFHTTINGVPLACDSQGSSAWFDAARIAKYHLCRNLPPSIVLGKTRVTLLYWVTRAQEHDLYSDDNPATDAIYVPPTVPFSSNPHAAIQSTGIPNAQNTQKFSGAFVERLLESFPISDVCLTKLRSADLEIWTYADGMIASDLDIEDCKKKSGAAIAFPAEAATSQLTLSVDRIVALGLAFARFQREVGFAPNDRDLALYDVSVADKDGVVIVRFEPTWTIPLIVGCEDRGPTSALYFVDTKALAVAAARRVC